MRRHYVIESRQDLDRVAVFACSRRSNLREKRGGRHSPFLPARQNVQMQVVTGTRDVTDNPDYGRFPVQPTLS
jgi:hypothetical protein